ncbi:hypothetical protein EV179_001021 [Coemansia sp. RSA 487]|nr:hypothetical protein EV179_001021 [Coemansia sp. RSA 487]
MSFSYYIEVLDSLGIVDIYVGSAVGKQNDYCSSGASEDIAGLVDESTVNINDTTTVHLPASVLIKSATRSILRAPMSYGSKELRQKDAPQLITNVAKPVSSDLLQSIQGISCQYCRKRLDACSSKVRQTKQSIRELPSTYWSELIDCWVCHPEEDNINVNTDLLHIFEPEIGQEILVDDSKASSKTSGDSLDTMQIWIGETYILVPTSYLQPLPTHEVHLAEKKRFYNKYSALSCDGCGKVLGEVGKMGPKRLYKLQTISVSLSQVFCREMLSHASAHAVYKFVVESREACTPVAIVHLVGWNAEIQAGSSHAGGMDAFEKCAKVLFTKAGDGEFQSRANKSLEDDTTELLSLLEDDCNKLVLLLTQNSRFIPPQLRAMAGLTRSFLQM